MAAEFLARTKVSFVKTAVLSSNDGGNTFNEETTIKNKTDEQGNAITAEEMKRIEKMNKKRSTGTNLSLYEQLEKNKAEKDELWKAKHGPQAPKTDKPVPARRCRRWRREAGPVCRGCSLYQRFHYAVAAGAARHVPGLARQEDDPLRRRVPL